MTISKDISFKEVCKTILSTETYEVFNKYNCFEKIQKVIDNHKINPGDFFDLACFFHKTTVVRIINDQKEIIIKDIKPNQMFLIDFRFESFSSTKAKQKEYATRFNIDDSDIVTEAYDVDLDDFVVLLHKEYDEDEYTEIRKILYSCIYD